MGDEVTNKPLLVKLEDRAGNVSAKVTELFVTISASSDTLPPKIYTIEHNEIVVHSVFDNRQDPEKKP